MFLFDYIAYFFVNNDKRYLILTILSEYFIF